MAEPLADADVPGWWNALGIPGLFDVHVHFLPPPILRKVREQFDSAGPVCSLATGPEPACTTIGVPTSSSVAHTSSSSGSSSRKSPTCTWILNTSTPSATSSATYAAASGSGKNVADHNDSGTSVANCRAQWLRNPATPGLWA